MSENVGNKEKDENEVRGMTSNQKVRMVDDISKILKEVKAPRKELNLYEHEYADKDMTFEERLQMVVSLVLVMKDVHQIEALSLFEATARVLFAKWPDQIEVRLRARRY